MKGNPPLNQEQLCHALSILQKIQEIFNTSNLNPPKQENNQLSTMSDKDTSTLQSYIDSATGAVQSALGSLTGSTSDQVCDEPLG
jgi:hypothetical protein